MATAIQSPMAQANAPAAVMNQPPAVVTGGFGNASLYVGDLDKNVNEEQLLELFGQVGTVASVRVCRDQSRGQSLGYAYVNYASPQEASNAMEMLNFTSVNGKPIRIMFSYRDPSLRKSGYANVFVKNLDTSIDNKALHDSFSVFGTILSCKVAVDRNGQSKGYGFVQFAIEESAQNAIKRLNGMLLNDKQVYVGLFVRRQERNEANGSPRFFNVYVKNLPEETTDEDLKMLFGSYGTITSAVVMRDPDGKSRHFGFVNFEDSEAAAAAVEKLNGTTIGEENVLYVGRAQKKGEREAELRSKFEQERISRYEKLQGANLYIKNLEDNVTDENLKELFSEFGTITSCKVMFDQHGHTKGCGFVAFSSPEEATRALNSMNNKMVGQKPLYVAVAQRREERKARLLAQFSQLRAPGVIPPFPSGVHGFHPGTPRVGPQQLFYGQGAAGLMPPQPAGFGFQPGLLPGMRPGVAPNFIMPYQLQRQGQHGQRMTIRRGGNHPQHMHQQQFRQHNSGQGLRYMGNPRNSLDQSAVPQGVIGPVLPSLGYSGPRIPTSPTDIQQSRPLPASTLASALASATPEDQRVMLGEQLYPLVARVELSNAAKVTGMLLEMDQPEVLHLIESPDALKIKVAEAMEVLKKAAGAESEVSNQLGSLALDE